MILLVSTTHERPDLLRAQMENYNMCFDDEVFHIVHVNRAHEKEFHESCKRMSVSFEDMTNVHLFSRVETAWGAVFHAMMHGILEAQRLELKPDYVYFHTNSDLLIKRGVGAYVRQFDLGMGTPDMLGPNDYWSDLIRKNERLPQYLAWLSHEHVMRVRSEGCFFRTEIFYELVLPLAMAYTFDGLRDFPPYPVEETELANAVEFYCQRHAVRRTRNLVKTTDVVTTHGRSQVATTDLVDEAIATPEIYGIKRFMPQLNDSVRAYVRSQINAQSNRGVEQQVEP